MLTPDQLKRYWVELRAVMEKRAVQAAGNVGSNDSFAPSAQDKDSFRAQFHAQHNLPASTKDFTRAHFDTFLAACHAITKPADLKPQLRAFDQPKARLLHKILVEQAAQLKALGKADPAITIGQISRQKFHGRHFDQLSAVPRSRPRPSPGGEGGPHGPGEGERALDDSPKRYSELEMLMFTVARTISELRQDKGWTVHELLWNAGLGKTCACAQCKKVGRVAPRAPLPTPELADNVPF